MTLFVPGTLVFFFNIFVKATNLRLGLHALKEAQACSIKLLKQRLFALVGVLQRKCVCGIFLCKTSTHVNHIWGSTSNAKYM